MRRVDRTVVSLAFRAGPWWPYLMLEVASLRSGVGANGGESRPPKSTSRDGVRCAVAWLPGHHFGFARYREVLVVFHGGVWPYGK